MKAILGIVAAIVVVGGGAWYFSSNPGTGTPEGANDTGDATAEGTGSASFADFIALGGSRECTVTVNNPDAPATGTVYVSGGDVRSDFVAKPVTMNGAEVAAHMIQADGYVYTWTDMMPQGVKIAVSATGSGDASVSSNGFDMSSQVDYDCRAWIPDASKFAVPSTVTFMEFNGSAGTGMPQGMPSMPVSN